MPNPPAPVSTLSDIETQELLTEEWLGGFHKSHGLAGVGALPTPYNLSIRHRLVGNLPVGEFEDLVRRIVREEQEGPALLAQYAALEAGQDDDAFVRRVLARGRR